MAEESFHPRTLWDLFNVTGHTDITASTDHDHKAYRDRQEVRWRRLNFRDYQQGMVVTWLAVGSNTGPATLNINNRGPKDLKDSTGVPLGSGDMANGAAYMAVYTGTEFRLLTGVAGTGGGGVTSVALQDTNDDTTTISGSPITTSGTLSIDAVDAGEDSFVMWDEDLGKKVYVPVTDFTGGGVTSVALQDTNDDTTVISGSPVTTSGTLSIDAVDAGEDSVVIWDDALGKKVYRALSDITGTPCTPFWIRFAGDGTALAGVNITVDREEVGTYLCTASEAFEEAGGFSQYGVDATISAAASGDGEGVVPFKKYDSNNPQATGQTSAEDFCFSRSERKIYVLCEGDDKIWIHDIDNWGAGATTVTPGSPIRDASNSGCITPAGDIIYLSGDSGYPVRAFVTATSTTTALGGNFDAICIGADDSGNLWVYTGGVVRQYTPSIGGGTLGSIVASYSMPIQSYLAMDHDGNMWGFHANQLHRFKVGGGLISYDPPATTFVKDAVIQADHPNRCLYVTIHNTAVGNQGYLYRFSGWSGTAAVGTWQLILTAPKTTSQFLGAWYDPESGVFYGVDSATAQTVQRFLPSVERMLDSVYVDDTTGPDNPEVDYDLTGSRNALYLEEYGYVLVTKSTVYLMRISYKGPSLAGTGAGGFISSVLNWAYEIISDTEAYIYVFRSGAPVTLADAEVTVHFVHCTEDEGGGGGGGGGVEAGAITTSGLTMSTNRLLGRTTASTGAIEEITVTANNGLLLASQALSIDRATQTDMETPTTGNKIVASTAMLYHPGVAKAWCAFDASASLLGPFYNIGAVSDNGTGDWTVSIAGSFPLSSANGTIVVSAVNSTPVVIQCVSRVSASAYQIKCWDLTGTLTDPSSINFAIFGDCS